jgi:hypothetical protein
MNKGLSSCFGNGTFGTISGNIYQNKEVRMKILGILLDFAMILLKNCCQLVLKNKT